MMTFQKKIVKLTYGTLTDFKKKNTQFTLILNKSLIQNQRRLSQGMVLRIACLYFKKLSIDINSRSEID